jgi:hypothetical protein
MAIIQVKVVKNIVEDVLIDVRANANTKLSLPKPRLAPHHLIIVDQNMTIILKIIKN